jgi:S-adenosylmethionine-diacylglycerol 3-amino-3-carboxypropyl transferase
MDTTISPWVAAAARLPVAFAQVREDADLDRWVIEQRNEAVRVLMVASGGCTAGALAAGGRVVYLHLVDPNPAQLALPRLKLHLLQTTDPAERLALLGHGSLPTAERQARLTAALKEIGLLPDALGPASTWAEQGPDHAGRYEVTFANLREGLSDRANEVAELMQLRDPAEQAARVEPSTPLGRALDAAFDDVMSLPNLVALFGEGATRNRVEPFARHFARRTRHVLATLPAADNPYLWQVLAGRYPPGTVIPWLNAPAPSQMPKVTWANTMMTDALRAAPGILDLVHLSNILDWLSPDEARATLDLAWSALRPGGQVFIRQLNSTLEIPALSDRFTWHVDQANALHARDRSYFYRTLHLGSKR